MKTHAILMLLLAAGTVRADLERIRVDGDRFVGAESGRTFVAHGFNYDHKEDGRLLEDYWIDLWPEVVSDFQEMKALGANVVRIHLQLGKFMTSADTPNQATLDQLGKLVELAEETGLYLNLTGLGCYHKQDVPAWYDALSEPDRWAVQARFWEAIATTCAKSPAIFCYDLMNEPILPGKKTETDWLAGEFGGKHFVQRISLDLAGRDRKEVARAWINTLVTAIRKHDKQALVTVGVIPWAHTWPKAKPLFHAEDVGKNLDFVSVHFYPKKGEVEKALTALKVYETGKPLVIEEMFTLKCGKEELGTFIDESRDYVDGYIGFYWGKPIDAYTKEDGFAGAFTVAWLELFREKFNPPETWPQWRGPNADGIAPDANPPTVWSEEKNIRWKVPLEGEGHSTPVLWDDRLFVTAAVPFGEKVEAKPDTAPGAHDFRMLDRHFDYRVIAINRADGKLLWQRSIHKGYPQQIGVCFSKPPDNRAATPREVPDF